MEPYRLATYSEIFYVGYVRKLALSPEKFILSLPYAIAYLFLHVLSISSNDDSLFVERDAKLASFVDRWFPGQLITVKSVNLNVSTSYHWHNDDNGQNSALKEIQSH